MIRVLYLARLRDALGTSSEELPAAHNVAQLLTLLRARGEPWAIELAEGKAFKVAVNQQIATASTAILAGDEIAFLPPVTGG
jgi:sulfur-carrier protein